MLLTRGTTPTLVFELPFPAITLTAVSVVMAQGGTIIMERDINEVNMDGSTVRVTLTQQETLMLAAGSTVDIQLRMLVGTTAMASTISTMAVGAILKDGALA